MTNTKFVRYGFHGTSHSFVSQKVAELLGKPYDSLKTIVCHLGNGASVCAVDKGKSVDTSMGLTPLEGLIMGTRSGDVDPSVLEFIAKKDNIDITGVLNILNKKSGLLGMSDGLGSDFRDIREAAGNGNEKAKVAMDAFAYRVAKYVGAYAAAMNGVDVIAFTAGIGEHASCAPYPDLRILRISRCYDRRDRELERRGLHDHFYSGFQGKSHGDRDKRRACDLPRDRCAGKIKILLTNLGQVCIIV